MLAIPTEVGETVDTLVQTTTLLISSLSLLALTFIEKLCVFLWKALASIALYYSLKVTTTASHLRQWFRFSLRKLAAGVAFLMRLFVAYSLLWLTMDADEGWSTMGYLCSATIATVCVIILQYRVRLPPEVSLVRYRTEYEIIRSGLSQKQSELLQYDYSKALLVWESSKGDLGVGRKRRPLRLEREFLELAERLYYLEDQCKEDQIVLQFDEEEAIAVFVDGIRRFDASLRNSLSSS